MSSKISVVALLLVLAIPVIATAQEDYYGSVRVFVVEPTSRWHDSYGVDYEFGFLDFALEQQFDVKQLGSWQATAQWTANQAGFEGVTEDNVAVIVVINADEAVTTDAFPPYGYFFDAYYVDRATMVLPGAYGLDNPTGGFTHTVFIEQGATSG